MKTKISIVQCELTGEILGVFDDVKKAFDYSDELNKKYGDIFSCVCWFDLGYKVTG